jgi:pimeloyl-ACP methyl ester carboxylesterase
VPTSTILVPGTQATTLQDQNGQVVYNPVAIGLPLFPKKLGSYPPEQWAPLMSMTYAAGSLQPQLTSRLPGTSVGKARMVETPYAPLLSYDPWPYDWRADIEANAQLLLAEVRRRFAASGPVNLVGHSQGGLVIVVASKLAAEGELARMVGEVVLVGAPLAGTMRAAEALIFGSGNLGEGQEGAARTMARTWPALYQMLPSWAAVTDPGGNPLPADQQLLNLQGWPAGWNDGVTQDMLNRAARVQGLLKQPLSHLPADRTMVMMGTAQVTQLSVIRDGSGFTRIVTRPNAGDTLVPFSITQQMDPSEGYQNAIVPLSTGVRAHAELCSDPTVSTLVLKLVRGFAPAAAPSPVHKP